VPELRRLARADLTDKAVDPDATICVILSGTVQERLSALPAGSLVRLTVLRDGQQVELSAPRRRA
jgi:hypothetical protein